MIIWMALAMEVTTRLWLAGVVSQHRDRALIDQLFQHVRASCQFMQGLLVCTDGFAAYPKSIVRAFREKVKKHVGRGRCSFEAWPDLCIATVIKHTKKKRVVEITRKVARGTGEKAKELLLMTKGCTEFNTACIERLNGTFRERLAPLTRKCRHAAARMETLEGGMYLVGCTYNFCFPHQELSKKSHFGCPTTPAMAAVLPITSGVFESCCGTKSLQHCGSKPHQQNRNGHVDVLANKPKFRKLSRDGRVAVLPNTFWLRFSPRREEWARSPVSGELPKMLEASQKVRRKRS